ncbi:hypothetical protein FM117_04800 [Micrococcus luteus Mu201]|nr:hypothetical protein FM117_04800 [Micrococcus luteus Mu201]
MWHVGHRLTARADRPSRRPGGRRRRKPGPQGPGFLSLG